MAMNLHAIAAPFVAIVTGTTTATWLQSSGYTTNPAGMRTPTFTATTIDVRVQSMSTPELALMDGMGIQGIKRAVYAAGHLAAADRKTGAGGDLLQFHGETWLVVAVLEDWDQSGWSKVAVTKQMDPTP